MEKNKICTVRVHYNVCTEITVTDANDADEAIRIAIMRTGNQDLNNMEITDVEAFIKDTND